MKRKLLAILAAVMLAGHSEAQRIVQSLDFGWRFHAGTLSDGSALGLDDTQWTVVDLPHDFLAEQPWAVPAKHSGSNAITRLSSRGYREMGTGWYRLHLTPADSLQGRRLLLDFGGIMLTGDIYINGTRVGGTDYGYVDFDVDATPYLVPGQDNVIAVKADTQEANNSRWYTGGGLIRGVRLIATDKELFFARHPLYITTRDNRFVTISAEVVTKKQDTHFPVGIRITDSDGRTVYEGQHHINRISPSLTVEQKLGEIEITDPKVWSPEHPSLYTVHATLYDEAGRAVDCVSERFGLRTIEFGPAFGFRLNGQKLLLQGFAGHHALGALGAAAYPRAIEKRLRLLKQWGVNHVRTSHNPYSREFIELCDSLGLLVVDELYDKWTRQYTGGRVPFEGLWQKDVAEWVKRDRNSPSVILWSLGNELQQSADTPFNDWGVTMYRLMRPLVDRYDSTRLATVAMHPRYRNWRTDSLPPDLAMVTDVQSYNYRYMYFPEDGRRFPWMTFYQSEASVAAMGQNFFEMNLNRVIGLAYWGLIDYLGESQGWPAKGWPSGVFDIALDPKPKAWYMRSFFLPDEPTVHLAVVDSCGKNKMWEAVQLDVISTNDHWNYPAGRKLSVLAYTNANEVELLLNGRSLGVRKNPINNPRRRNQVHWDSIAYEPGKLEAVARKNGEVVARHVLETTGNATHLAAKADLTPPTVWRADGYDLQHVRVTALDNRQRQVKSADAPVTFSVSGPARIVGVVNGDINSNEMMVGNTRSLYNGAVTVILRSTTQPGVVTLKASAPGLKPTTLLMHTMQDKR